MDKKFLEELIRESLNRFLGKQWQGDAGPTLQYGDLLPELANAISDAKLDQDLDGATARIGWAHVLQFLTLINSDLQLPRGASERELLRLCMTVAEQFRCPPPPSLLGVLRLHNGLFLPSKVSTPLYSIDQLTSLIDVLKDGHPTLLPISGDLLGNYAALLVDPSNAMHGSVFAFWHEDVEAGEPLQLLARNVAEYLVIGWPIAETLEGGYPGPSAA